MGRIMWTKLVSIGHISAAIPQKLLFLQACWPSVQLTVYAHELARPGVNGPFLL